MIRHACKSDLERILDLATEAHELSPTYRHLPPNRDKARESISAMLTNPMGYVGVVDDGEIHGILIAVAAESWAHDGLIVSDLLFYARKNGRSLLSHYLDWADGFPQPKINLLGISFGGDKAERTEQLYQRLGFTKVGAQFIRGDA